MKRFGFVLIFCLISLGDAAYKIRDIRDKHDHSAGHLHHGVNIFQQFLRPYGEHPDPKRVPYMNTDVKFRSGQGFTNQEGTDDLDCPEVCPMNLQPVCGSDGRSYSNECELKVNACKQRKRIYVEREGYC